MVTVDNHPGILQILLIAQIVQLAEILVMIIRIALPVLIRKAPKDRMGIRIPLRLNLPPPVDQAMGKLRRLDTVHQSDLAPSGRILHPHRYTYSAGCKSVLLVLH